MSPASYNHSDAGVSHGGPPSPRGRVVMGDDVIQQILVALARIEERIKAQTEQSEHRHNNMKLAVEGFVPRRELDERFRSMEERLERSELRQDRADGHISKAAWAIVTAWLSGIGVVVSLLMKKM